MRYTPNIILRIRVYNSVQFKMKRQPFNKLKIKVASKGQIEMVKLR